MPLESLFFLLSLLCAVTSCSDDVDVPGNVEHTLTEHSDLPGYFTISVDAGAPSPIAESYDGFTNGEAAEYAVAPTGDHHFVLLFPKGAANSDKPVAIITLRDVSSSPINPEGRNITLVASSIIKEIDDLNGETYTTTDEIKELLVDKECYVILNTDSTVITFASRDLGAIMNLQQPRTYITVNGVKYFTMANSVYVGNDANGNSAIIRNGNVIADNVFEEEEDAIRNPAIIATVERMAAKFTVDLSPLALDGDHVYTPVDGQTVDIYERLDDNADSYQIVSRSSSYKVKILGYGVNALEPSERIFRKIDNKNYYNGWNDAANMRCYWSDDIHYNVSSGNTRYAEKYPHQFRRALESDTVRSFHDGNYTADGSILVNATNDGETGYFLNYVSFNDITGGEGMTSYPATFYSNENTYSDSGESYKNTYGMETGTLWERGCYSAGTHLLIACELSIDDDDYKDVEDLYLGQNEIFYKNATDIIDAKLRLFNQIVLPGGTSDIRILSADWLGHLSNREYNEGINNADDLFHLAEVSWNVNSVLWVGNQNDPVSAVRATVDDFTLIPAEISGGDGQLLIAPAAKNIGRQFWIAPPADGDNNKMNQNVKATYDEDDGRGGTTTRYEYWYVPFSYNQLVSLFHKLIGAISHYKNGYMYYAVPIEHNPVTTGVPWTTVGYYGVVRNNWYDTQITAIKGIGIPVDDPSQPIIPRLEANREYLNVTVRLLDWHYITQNVPFIPWTD